MTDPELETNGITFADDIAETTNGKTKSPTKKPNSQMDYRMHKKLGQGIKVLQNTTKTHTLNSTALFRRFFAHKKKRNSMT